MTILHHEPEWIVVEGTHLPITRCPNCGSAFVERDGEARHICTGPALAEYYCADCDHSITVVAEDFVDVLQREVKR